MMASAQARQQLPLRTPPSAWGTACPPLCAVRGAPDDVLLGPGPSLQILRRRFPALVRTLRGYYGPVRLLGGVRVGRAAVAFPHRPATSRQAPPRSPGSRAGSFLTCTGSPTAPGSSAASDSAAVDMAFPFCPQGRHPNLGISRLNRRPASASVNASPAMSPSPAHDSRSAWFATPSLWGSFIPNSPPVYPGAFGQSQPLPRARLNVPATSATTGRPLPEPQARGLGWIARPAAGVTVSNSRDRTGTAVLLVEFQQPRNTRYRHLTRGFSVKPERAYSLQAEVRTEQLRGSEGIRVMVSSPKRFITSSQPIAKTTPWRAVTLEFITQRGEEIIRVVIARNRGQRLDNLITGKFFLRNLNLRQQPPQRRF